MRVEEHHILPNKEEVTYFDDTHTYIVRGKEVPSITTLLKKIYGDIYGNVNPELLKRSAEYGTAVHAELQHLIDMRIENPNVPIFSEYQEVQNYFNLVEYIYKIDPIMTEKVVVLYNEKNEPVAAGRFDLLCNVKGEMTLADFKTTSQIHRQQVTAQLNLYLTAAYQSGYLENTNIKLGVIHLSGNTSKFMPIAKLKDDFYLKFIK